MKLPELNKDLEATVVSVNGDTRFISRVTSIGITPGCRIKMIKNEKRRPLLVFSRDSMIALNRNECEGIEVELCEKTVQKEVI